jgi:hypothetical protein
MVVLANKGLVGQAFEQVVAAQSVEGLGDHRQALRLLASCTGG